MKNIFKIDLIVEVKIVRYSDAKSVIAVLRAYSKESIGILSKALRRGDVVFKAPLNKSQFYRGWKNLYDLCSDLKSSEASLEIIVNGSVENIDFMEELKSVVLGIRREDLY